LWNPLTFQSTFLNFLYPKLILNLLTLPQTFLANLIMYAHRDLKSIKVCYSSVQQYHLYSRSQPGKLHINLVRYRLQKKLNIHFYNCYLNILLVYYKGTTNLCGLSTKFILNKFLKFTILDENEKKLFSFKLLHLEFWMQKFNH